MSGASNASFVDHGTSNNRSGWLSVAIAIFGGTALLTLAVRAWIRLSSHGPWARDDTAVLVSFVLSIAQIAATGVALHNGYGQHYDDLSPLQISLVQKALYVAQFFYILSSATSRCSSALLVVRLTRYKPHVRAAFSVAAFTALWASASIIAIALRGNLSMPWATMDGQQPLYLRWIGIEAVAMFDEVALFCLSVYLIWGLHMVRVMRLMILTAFACRLLIIPIIAARLYFLNPSRNPDLTFSTIISGVITQVAMHYCEIAGSMICLKPFVRAFSAGYVVNSAGGEGSGVGGPNDRFRMLRLSHPDLSNPTNSNSTGKSAFSSQHKSKTSGSELRSLARESDFRNHPGEFVARASSGDEQLLGLAGAEDMVIRQTKVWAVHRGAADET